MLVEYVQQPTEKFKVSKDTLKNFLDQAANLVYFAGLLSL